MFKYRIEFFGKNRFTEYQEGSYTPSASFSDIATKVTISPSKLSSPSGFTLQTPVTAKLTFIGDVFNKSEEVSTCASFLLDKVVRGTEYVVEKEWDETLSPTQYPEARMLEAYHPYLQRAGNNEVIIGSNSGFLDQVVVIYSTPIVGSTEVQTETKVFTGLITASSIEYDVDEETISFSCTDFLGILKKIESFGVNMLPAGLFPLSGKFILKGEVEDSTGVKHTFDGEKAWRNGEFDMDTIDGERLAVTVPIVYEETPGGTEIPLTVEVEELNKFALQDTEDWGTGRVPLAGTYDREMLRKTVRFISAYMGRGFTLESNLDTVDDYKETTPIRADYELARGAGVSERFSRRRFASKDSIFSSFPELTTGYYRFVPTSIADQDAPFGRITGRLYTFLSTTSPLKIHTTYWVDAYFSYGFALAPPTNYPPFVNKPIEVRSHFHFTATELNDDGTIGTNIELVPTQEDINLISSSDSVSTVKGYVADKRERILEILDDYFRVSMLQFDYNPPSAYFENKNGNQVVDKNVSGYIPAEDPDLSSTDEDTYTLFMRDGFYFIKTLQYSREVLKLSDVLNLILTVNNLSLSIDENGVLFFLNRVVSEEAVTTLQSKYISQLKGKRVVAPESNADGFQILNMANKNQQDIADAIQEYNNNLVRESNYNSTFTLFDDTTERFPIKLGSTVAVRGVDNIVYQLEQTSKHARKLSTWKKGIKVTDDVLFIEDIFLSVSKSGVDLERYSHVTLGGDPAVGEPFEMLNQDFFVSAFGELSVDAKIAFRTNLQTPVRIEMLWLNNETWETELLVEQVFVTSIEEQYLAEYVFSIAYDSTPIIGADCVIKISTSTSSGDIVRYSQYFTVKPKPTETIWNALEDFLDNNN